MEVLHTTTLLRHMMEDDTRTGAKLRLIISDGDEDDVGEFDIILERFIVPYKYGGRCRVPSARPPSTQLAHKKPRTRPYPFVARLIIIS
jgi:hypothetical protein